MVDHQMFSLSLKYMPIFNQVLIRSNQYHSVSDRRKIFNYISDGTFYNVHLDLQRHPMMWTQTCLPASMTATTYCRALDLSPPFFPQVPWGLFWKLGSTWVIPLQTTPFFIRQVCTWPGWTKPEFCKSCEAATLWQLSEHPMCVSLPAGRATWARLMCSHTYLESFFLRHLISLF